MAGINKYKLRTVIDKYKLRAGADRYKLGLGAWVGSRETQMPPPSSPTNNKTFEHGALIFTEPWALANEVVLNIM